MYGIPFPLETGISVWGLEWYWFLNCFLRTFYINIIIGDYMYIIWIARSVELFCSILQVYQWFESQLIAFYRYTKIFFLSVLNTICMILLCVLCLSKPVFADWWNARLCFVKEIIVIQFFNSIVYVTKTAFFPVNACIMSSKLFTEYFLAFHRAMTFSCNTIVLFLPRNVWQEILWKHFTYKYDVLRLSLYPDFVLKIQLPFKCFVCFLFSCLFLVNCLKTILSFQIKGDNQ